MSGLNRNLADDANIAAAMEAATFDLDAWRPLVDLLMTSFDSEVAGINTVDLLTGSVISASHNGLTAKAEAEYYMYLVHNDPRIPLVSGAAVGSAFSDVELQSDPLARKSDYYAWEADQAFRHTLCIKLVHSQSERSTIAIARCRDSGPHSDDVMARAQALAPRLAAAAAVNRRITALEGLNAMMDRVVEANAAAFGLFDGNGLLLHANAAFRAALDRRDGLGSESLALAVRATAAEGRPRAQQMRRRNGRMAYRVVLQPMTARAAEQRRFAWARSGAVLAFLDDPDAQLPGNRAHVLQQMFGLTGAEARVALLIADGEEVEAIARRQGVAVATVRTQLKSVFGKLGVSRQLGVARLVRGLPQFDG